MASALIYTHERYQSTALTGRDSSSSSMKKSTTPKPLPPASSQQPQVKLQQQQQGGYEAAATVAAAAVATPLQEVEAVSESDGRRQRHILSRKDSLTAPVKVDLETGSDDSRSLKRKSMSLNTDGVKDGSSDVVGAEPGLLLPDVHTLSRQEKSAHRKKLRMDLEALMTLYPRIDAREAELARRLNTPDGAMRRTGSSANVVARVDNNGVAATPGADPQSASSDVRAGGAGAEVRLSRVPSVIVPEHPLMGTPGAPGKEKRTPKANQMYLNSEFVSGKDRIPPPEKLKPKAVAGVKRGSITKLDPKDSKRQKVQTARHKRMADLFKQCMTLLKRLWNHKHAWVFKEPVDVVELGLHDYFKVIRKPMDLGTIKKNLEAGSYETPAEFADDVRLVFSNALTYNPKGHDVHTMAEIMGHNFESRWKAIEVKYEEEKMKIKFEDETLAQGSGQTQELLDLKQQLQSLEDKVSTHFANNSRGGRSGGPGRPAGAVRPKQEAQKRPMTFEEKQKLSENLEKQPAEKLGKIVQILRKRNPVLSQNDNEIEVDIETFDNETLWELERFVANCNKKKKAPATVTGETPKKARKGEGGEEEVDIDGDDAPSAQFPAVEVDKDAAAFGAKSSSSSSSGSDSGSSDSDSDSGSSSGSDSDVDEAQSVEGGAKGSPQNKEPLGSGTVCDQVGSSAAETHSVKGTGLAPVDSREQDANGGEVVSGRGGILSEAAENRSHGSCSPLVVDSRSFKFCKPAEKSSSVTALVERCSPATAGNSLAPRGSDTSPRPATEAQVSPGSGGDRQGSPDVPPERQLSPEKLLRAARMRDRFADTILKAQEKTCPSSKGEKVDPEKMKREREEMEKRQREEKARLQAEAKAAEAARKKAQAEALAEQLRKREAEREAARVALQQMEKTVEIDENSEILKDLERMGTTQLDLPSSGEDGSPDGSPEGRPNFGGPGIRPLEQLGLFMRQDEEEEEEHRDDPSLKVEENGDAGDVEEGEID